MNKIDMRMWVSSLEEVIDNKLKKWLKRRIENGEAVQVHYQHEQTHMIMDIFWEDKQETVNLLYLSPRADHRFTWHGLNNKTFNKIMDRAGNLAQMTMYPLIDPLD